MYCSIRTRRRMVILCFVVVSINSLLLAFVNNVFTSSVKDKLSLGLIFSNETHIKDIDVLSERDLVKLYKQLIDSGLMRKYTRFDDVDGKVKGDDQDEYLTEFEWVDWNDYRLMQEDANRTGLGEHGDAVDLGKIKKMEENETKLNAKYKYNVVLSDMISLERSIGDLRTAACKKQKFIKNIPRNSVSIISVFYNERLSTLLRTLHSIFKRSPASLLREVVLVDDTSSDEELKKPLDDYVRTHFPKVKVVRNQHRAGLIQSRMIGADASTGRYLVFLDSHMEVNYNYLPPLIEPMVFNYRAIVCPMVDFINADTLRVDGLTSRVRSGFDWSLSYKRIPLIKMDDTTPHPTPTMVGCAFAISRKWWEELGKYDPGLQIWGAEQYEISFKSWMCGGSVVDAPCSRIAHLFRPLPYVRDVVAEDIIERNLLRLASVWMDDYKDVVMNRRPKMKNIDPGNLTSQFEIRKKLKCKSFQWFLEEVAPDILQYYPVVTPLSVAYGKIRSNKNSSLCITTKHHLKLVDCTDQSATTFTFDWRFHIESGKCLYNAMGEFVSMFECLDFEDKPTQRFAFNRHIGRIANFQTRLCLDYDMDTLKLKMKKCDDTSLTQNWTLENVNTTLADQLWSKYEAVSYHYILE